MGFSLLPLMILFIVNEFFKKKYRFIKTENERRDTNGDFS